MERFGFVLIALITISFFLHFWGLEYPNEVVFDEVHFGKLAGYYFSGNYTFDIHPPLGKLIIAAGGALAGFKPSGFGFESIGLKYPDNSYYGMRFFPALAGSLLPLIIFLLIRKLGGSRKAAILGMVLTILESGLLVQSRIILFDIFILFFGLLGLLFYLYSRDRRTSKRKVLYLLVSGLFLGASLSVKLTGIVFLFLVFLLSLINLLRHFNHKKSIIKPTILFFVSFVIIPLLFYVAVFAIHFSLLPNSGQGDAFMTQKFQSTLIGNSNYNSSSQMGFFQRFLELNNEMFAANARLNNTHPYGIKWYEMPVIGRPIYYWNKGGENTMARIYLIGNPFIWWMILVGVAAFIGTLIFNLVKRKWVFFKTKEMQIILLVAYFVNWLTFAFMSRVVFIYHYFPSLIFGLILFCLFFEKAFVRSRMKYMYWVVIGLSIVGFIYFSPLTYGWQLDEQTYNFLVWFNSWK